jgi:hypothetical protein
MSGNIPSHSVVTCACSFCGCYFQSGNFIIQHGKTIHSLDQLLVAMR